MGNEVEGKEKSISQGREEEDDEKEEERRGKKTEVNGEVGVTGGGGKGVAA